MNGFFIRFVILNVKKLIKYKGYKRKKMKEKMGKKKIFAQFFNYFVQRNTN